MRYGPYHLSRLVVFIDLHTLNDKEINPEVKTQLDGEIPLFLFISSVTKGTINNYIKQSQIAFF